MNATLEAVYRSCSNSKSTDKLALIMAGLESLPPAKLDKMKAFEVTWRTETTFDGGAIVPTIKLEFFE